MLVGVPKEIKTREYRVGMTPESVRELVEHGHTAAIETGAGHGIGASDETYAKAGATILRSAAEVFERADMIVKVKEPQAQERKLLRQSQILFTYLHLAPDPDQTRDLIASGAVCIAYETVTGRTGGLPLLAPMSEVAGRMAVQAGAHFLEKAHGGSGLLLGGVPGVPPGKVTILGGGVVGSNAAMIAVGMGARVAILDKNPDVLRRLWAQFGSNVETIYSTRGSVERHLASADLVIGGVLVPGAAAPRLIRRSDLKQMKPGSVVVDVAIDQGGCMETSRPTTHDDPTYVVDNIVHYCVANMPGGVPRTSTYALNNATLPFILALADKGWQRALRDDPHLAEGLNIWRGKVTNKAVAEAFGTAHTEVAEALG